MADLVTMVNEIKDTMQQKSNALATLSNDDGKTLRRHFSLRGLGLVRLSYRPSCDVKQISKTAI